MAAPHCGHCDRHPMISRPHLPNHQRRRHGCSFARLFSTVSQNARTTHAPGTRVHGHIEHGRMAASTGRAISGAVVSAKALCRRASPCRFAVVSVVLDVLCASMPGLSAHPADSDTEGGSIRFVPPGNGMAWPTRRCRLIWRRRYCEGEGRQRFSRRGRGPRDAMPAGQGDDGLRPLSP